MATKYQQQGFQFQPYQSVYSKQHSAEIAQHLKTKYDEGQQNINLIDQFLSTIEHSPAEAHLVTDIKDQIEGMFSTIIETGAYERASNTIMKAQNLINTDPGLLAVQKSWKLREHEIQWMTEANQDPNKTVLDFGEGSWDNHVSYYFDDDGNGVENIYQPKAEIMGDYNAEMLNLIKQIPAGTYGIDDARLDELAKSLVANYITASPVGDQDFRRLMELELKDIEDPIAREKAAYANMEQRMRNLLEQWKHQRIVKSEIDNKGNPHGAGLTYDPNKTQQVTDVSITTEDLFSDPAELSLNFLQAKSGEFDWSTFSKEGGVTLSERELEDSRFIYGSFINTALSEKGIDPKQITKHHNFVIDAFDGHEAFGALVDFMTRPHSTLDFYKYDTFGPTGQPMIDAKEMGTHALVGGTALWGLKKLIGKRTSWLRNLIGVAGASFVVNAIDNKMLDNFNNVRDILKFKNDEHWGEFLNPFPDEQSVLVTNLMDVEKVNELLGTDYKLSPQYEQLVKNALALLTYRQEGGDELDGIIDAHNGPVFNAQMYTGNYLFGKDTGWSSTDRANLKAAFDGFTLADFDILGLPENSPQYNDFLGIDDKNPKGGKTIEFLGVTTPDPIGNVPIYFKVRIGGNQIAMVRSKVASSSDFIGSEKNSTHQSIEYNILKKLGLGDLAIMDEARVRLNEKYYDGKSLSNLDLYEAIANSWNGQVVNGVLINEMAAKGMAQSYLIEKFEKEHPQMVLSLQQNTSTVGEYRATLWAILTGQHEEMQKKLFGNNQRPWFNQIIK